VGRVPAPRHRPTPWLLLTGCAGAALAAVGAWLLTRPDPGWSAVAPLSGSTYAPSRPDALAVVLLVLGVVLLGGSVVAGVRRRRRGD
jgi:hypothetical protein